MVELPLAVGDVADSRALVLKRGHGHVPAHVLLADHVDGGDADVVEEDLVELEIVDHVHQGPNGDAWGAHVHDEVGDALVLGRIGVRPGQDVHPVGPVTQGGPDLLAVNDEIVAVADGRGLEVGQVGAGVGLREALTPDDFLVRRRREELFFQIVRAEADDGRADLVRLGVEGRVVVQHLVVKDGLHEGVGAEPAILHRPADADPLALAQLAAELHGLFEVLVGGMGLPAQDGGRKLLLDEVLDLLAKGLLFRSELEIQAQPPSTVATRVGEGPRPGVRV